MIWNIGVRVLGWGMCLGKYQMINRISTTMTVVVVSNYQLTITVQTKIVLLVLLHHISSLLRGENIFLKSIKNTPLHISLPKGDGRISKLVQQVGLFRILFLLL